MSLFQSISTDNLDEPTPFWTRKAAIYGFIITLLAISSVSASLRLYVRFFVSRCPGWDDYFIILIIALTWVTNVGSLFLVKHGLGRHFALLTLAEMEDFIHMFWWCNACYNMSMAAIKLSLLFQYLRLLADHPDSDRAQPRLLRLAIYALLGITSAWGLVYSLLAWVPCVPVYADWDFTVPATRYGYGTDDKQTFAETFMVHGACNMAIDIAIFSLPLFSRSMWATAGRARQSRIAMLSLYALGVLSVVCSIYRFVSIVEHRAATYPSFDPTWYGATAIVLSIIEVDIATTMASLPVFWPYLRRNIDRIMITHEVEIKVTEQHQQQHRFVESRHQQSMHNNNHNNNNHTNTNRLSMGKSQGGGGGGAIQLDHTAYTPWLDNDDRMVGEPAPPPLSPPPPPPSSFVSGMGSSPGRVVRGMMGKGKGKKKKKNVAGLTLGASAAISSDPMHHHHTKAGEVVVMMRDLGRSSTTNTDDNNSNNNNNNNNNNNDLDGIDESSSSSSSSSSRSNGGSPGEMDLPFDGTRTRSPALRSPDRGAFLTRNSKEGLLQ